MKNRGFTLVELLVTVVVLGIIMGLSFPVIRHVQEENNRKKYETYAEGMISSARLYVDSYDEDLFGHHDTGCAYITYQELIERKLLDEIPMADISCDSDNSFVRVVKLKDQYGYAYSLGCGKKTTGKVENPTVLLPKESAPTLDRKICKGREGASITVSSTDSGGFSRRKKTKVILTSVTGIHGEVEIYAAWIKGKDNRPDENTEWNRVNFAIPSKQEELILNGETIVVESEEVITNSTKQTNGSYYLWIRVDGLKDLYGEHWKNENGEENGKYVRGSEFKVDNTPPLCTYHGESTTWKTGSRTVTWGCRDEGEGASGCVENEGPFENIEQKHGSYTFPTTEKMRSQKTYPFPEYEITDIAGNKTVCNTKPANIYIDNTAPTCVDTIPTAWTSKDRTITWGCEDEEEGSGCQTVNKTTGERNEIHGSVTFTSDTEKVSPSPVRTYKIVDNVGHEVTCDVSDKLNEDGSMPVLVDKTKPILTVINPTLSMGAVDYDFKDNVTVVYGTLGGTLTCDPARSQMKGVYDVTCTAKNRSDLETSVTFKAQHSYPATPESYSYCAEQGMCPGGCVGGAWCCPPTSPCWGYCCNGSLPSQPCCKRMETGTRYLCPKGGKAQGATCYY